MKDKNLYLELHPEEPLRSKAALGLFGFSKEWLGNIRRILSVGVWATLGRFMAVWRDAASRYVLTPCPVQSGKRSNRRPDFLGSCSFASNYIQFDCPKTINHDLKLDRLCLIAVLAVAWGSVPVEAAAPAACRETLVKITSQRQGDQTQFFVQNLQAADVTVTLEFDSENLSSSVPLPVTRTLSGNERAEITKLAPANPDKAWRWSYTYYATFGSMSAKHDDACVYSLPYASGEAFRVSQGFHGKYSHSGANEFAIDWKMPLGTPVHAARGGTVVAVKDDSDQGGGDSRYDADANYVLIRHEDGTLGHYVHLLRGGSRVQVGDKVQTGDILALSGNTGHSTGPHLHFSVFRAKNGKLRETIPVRYRTSASEALVLETGKSYKAPGASAFYAAPKPQDKGDLGMGGS
jgi:murein DD-endopeptidase MepM/ murein hydrolase activator NlpD